jgi:hypothetical protein
MASAAGWVGPGGCCNPTVESVVTRLARALNSDDLSHAEGPCDADVLQAAGFTAIHRNLGVLIIEAKEGAAGEGSHAVARIKDLEHALGLRIKRMAQRWRIRVDVGRVASQVARELILDRCTHCQGRGFCPCPTSRGIWTTK